MNVTGINFANQKLTPLSDGVLYSRMLGDGTLKGCAIGYSGASLTMAAGWLLICGRQLQIPTAQTFAVDQATSGYARLKISIDLTRAATTQSFDQVLATVEYSNTLDGFPSLTQQDINASGTVYQISAAVVTLGIGGVTGIVSQLPPSADRLQFTDTAVDATAFVTYTPVGNEETALAANGFIYRAAVALTGVLESMIPDVMPSVTDVLNGILAPTAACYAGGVYLYAAAVPDSAITVPTIICWKAVS